MRILFLSAVLPHAHVVSGSIIVHNRIKLLAERGHKIGLASFLSEGDEAYLADLKPMLYEMEFIPRPPPRGRLRCATDYCFHGLPSPFATINHRPMHKLVGNMVERSHYDVVVAEFSVMGQFLFRNPYLPATRRVISCHSCLTTAIERAIELRWWTPDSIRRRIRLIHVQDYEFSMYRSADLVLTLTSQESLNLLQRAPDLRISVAPYGVDVEHFQPGPEQDSEESIVFTGYYSDEPNRDAVMWFVRTTWPQLRERHPELKFYVIGQNPTPAMLELAKKDPRIIVTGEVDDVAPYLKRARVYVCPMRMGTGFRGKILQAMASGVPVVSTTLAAEGIPAQTGENLLLADTPHVMEESLNLLLENPDIRRTLACNAREMVVKRFAWSHCVDLLETALQDIVS